MSFRRIDPLVQPHTAAALQVPWGLTGQGHRSARAGTAPAAEKPKVCVRW